MNTFSPCDWFLYLKFISLRTSKHFRTIELRFEAEDSRMPCGCFLNEKEAIKLANALIGWANSKKDKED